MRPFAWLSFLCWISVAVTARAQYLDPFYAGGSNNYHHASTAAEGASRGMADVIRSQGAANLMNSAAAINIEDARKKYIDNRLQATSTYFEMRRINREARAAARRPPPTQEQLVRFSKERLPRRIAPSQLDPLVGKLNWPTVLKMEPYKVYREQLDQLFAARAQNGYLSPDQYMKAKQLTDQMMIDLRKNVRSYPSSQSIQARKFIQSLAYEANMQPI
ncbi:MAG: hypothetical protein ACC628_02080 [Pirellulaceae bacterium]